MNDVSQEAATRLGGSLAGRRLRDSSALLNRNIMMIVKKP